MIQIKRNNKVFFTLETSARVLSCHISLWTIITSY